MRHDRSGQAYLDQHDCVKQVKGFLCITSCMRETKHRGAIPKSKALKLWRAVGRRDGAPRRRMEGRNAGSARDSLAAPVQRQSGGSWVGFQGELRLRGSAPPRALFQALWRLRANTRRIPLRPGPELKWRPRAGPVRAASHRGRER